MATGIQPAANIKENTYRGYRLPGGCKVTVDGLPLELTPTAKQHSPYGFEWGYGGSGPHALAISMVAHEMTPILGKEGAEQLADTVGYAFKEKFVATFPRQGGASDSPEWVLTGVAIRVWLAQYVEANPDKITAPWHDVELDDIWTE